MKRAFFYLLLLIGIHLASAQSDSLTSRYSFIIQDSPSRLFTMRQFDQAYLSGYRILARELNENIQNRKISTLIQLSLVTVFTQPLSHEEGHRSILTGQGIGSISRPFFNKQGAAYVTGVTDETLKNLRDTDLPNYIRLHTAGLESDYMLTTREEDLVIFGIDRYEHVKWDYWMRKFGIMQYYLLGLLKYELDLKEETNELDRDIVGLDTYGAARHLFRPDMNFHRYTTYQELTSDERHFLNRVGVRSFLNLMNPLLFGKTHYQLSENLKMNCGFGYTMAPFGDFLDENIWLIFNDRTNLKIYLRQFQNRENWFLGGGIGLYQFDLTDHLFVDSRLNFWNQPKNLDFNTAESTFGGALDLDLRYFFFYKDSYQKKGTSVDLGMTMKTEGYLPEEIYLTQRIGVRFGTTLWF